MKAVSAKNKGKRLENYIAQEIEAEGLGEACREIGSGSGKRKGDINCNLPFLIEAKHQKSIAWWSSIDQAKRQAEQGNYNSEKWALIVNDPRTKEFQNVYVVMDMWEWFKLLKKDSEPRIKAPDKALKWSLETLKTAINQVLKNIK